MTKLNAAMFMVTVMIVGVATATASASQDEYESYELVIQSSFKESESNKLHACCQNSQGWNCYRVCRLKGSQRTCAKTCGCKLRDEISPECYRGFTVSANDESPKLIKEYAIKEQGTNKLHACCDNSQRWNCYRVCRFKGNQRTCSNMCGCKLGEEIGSECYRGFTVSEKDDSPKLMKEYTTEEQETNKLHACCQNSQRWNCYRTCRLGVGSQQKCANYCSCVLDTEIGPSCYRSMNDETPIIMMTAQSARQQLTE